MKTTMTVVKAPSIKCRGVLDGINYPAIADRKYDGEFFLIFYNVAENRWEALNKYGKCIHECHALDMLSLDVNEELKQSCLLAELIYGNGMLGDLYKIKGANDSDLSFKIFDIISENLEGADLIDRKEYLARNVDPMYVSSFSMVEDSIDATNAAIDNITQGYEGVVIKSANGIMQTMALSLSRSTITLNWVKIKNTDENDFVVTFIDPIKERIEIQSEAIINNKTVLANVGVLVKNSVKATLQPGDTVTIKHFGLQASGSLRNPVFIKKVEKKGGI